MCLSIIIHSKIKYSKTTKMHLHMLKQKKSAISGLYYNLSLPEIALTLIFSRNSREPGISASFSENQYTF